MVLVVILIIGNGIQEPNKHNNSYNLCVLCVGAGDDLSFEDGSNRLKGKLIMGEENELYVLHIYEYRHHNGNIEFLMTFQDKQIIELWMDEHDEIKEAYWMHDQHAMILMNDKYKAESVYDGLKNKKIG
jgi:hypothetical protein